MRIGIITYHFVPNFGAQLQCISTIGYLKNKGHEPIVLHWYPYDLDEMYAKRIPANQLKEHVEFAQNMPLSKLCRTEIEVINEIERLQIDAIFVGSDALFKYIPESRRSFLHKLFPHFIKSNVISVEDIKENIYQGAFLGKIKHNIKAVAFSVSSQNCPFMELNHFEKEAINSSISHYGLISVRDEWTKKMIQYITGRSDINITPDPVFAFNQNCYLKVPTKAEILSKYSLPEKYVLISFWTKRLKTEYFYNLIKEIEKNNLTPVAFPMPEHLLDFGLEHKIELPLSPIDWYALIKHSQGYIGERMHPIIVCLHNAIPFYSFDEYGTFKKSLLGLQKKHIISSSKTYLVIKNSNLEDWHYSYFDKEKACPSSKDVVKKILNFPTEQCKKFAKQTLKHYNNSMSFSLTYLKND